MEMNGIGNNYIHDKVKLALHKGNHMQDYISLLSHASHAQIFTPCHLIHLHDLDQNTPGKHLHDLDQNTPGKHHKLKGD
jgi:hypothetical protein